MAVRPLSRFQIDRMPPDLEGALLALSNQLDIRDAGADTIRADNTQYIQTAINQMDDQGGGVVVVPEGDFNNLGTLSLVTNNPVTILGRGADVSVLRWPNDIGAGDLAIDAPTTGDNRYRSGIRHLTLMGPDADQGGLDAGEVSAEMFGIRLGPRMVSQACRVSGFYANIVVSGDHCSITETFSQFGYYHLYFHGASQFDDHYIADTDLSGARWANIAVGPGTDRLGGTTLISVHLGFGPFCFYKEGSHTSVNFIGGNLFLDCPCQGYGNGVIYDQDNACNVTDNMWIGCDETGGMSGSPYKLDPTDFPSYNQNYVVRNSFFSGNTFMGGSLFSDPGTVGIFDCGNWVRNTWYDAQGMISNLSSSFVLLNTGGFAEFNRIYNEYGTCRVLQAGSVSKYALLAPTGPYAARASVVGTDTIDAGVAQHATPASGWCVTQVEGRTPILSSGAITSLNFVKRGGADGKVVNDGAARSLNSCGYSTAADSGGQVTVFLQGIS